MFRIGISMDNSSTIPQGGLVQHHTFTSTCRQTLYKSRKWFVVPELFFVITSALLEYLVYLKYRLQYLIFPNLTQIENVNFSYKENCAEIYKILNMHGASVNIFSTIFLIFIVFLMFLKITQRKHTQIHYFDVLLILLESYLQFRDQYVPFVASIFV